MTAKAPDPLNRPSSDAVPNPPAPPTAGTPGCQHDERFKGVMFAKNGCACCSYEESIAELTADLAAARQELADSRAETRTVIEQMEVMVQPEEVLSLANESKRQLASRDETIARLTASSEEAQRVIAILRKLLVESIKILRATYVYGLTDENSITIKQFLGDLEVNKQPMSDAEIDFALAASRLAVEEENAG